MHDRNTCDCGCASPFDARRCRACDAEMYAPRGGLTLWLLEGTSARVPEKLADRLAFRFRRDVHVSPSRMAPGPTRRNPPWRGLSATAFLNQVHRRTRRGELALGITEQNIVPGLAWNYLFGLAYLGRHCAVMSLHPLRADGSFTSKVLARAENIAVHELGHALGLDHHAYEDGIDCVMTGDVEYDSVEALDTGTAKFCTTCAQRVAR